MEATDHQRQLRQKPFPQGPSTYVRYPEALQPPNHKRVDRVKKAHGLLLQRHAGGRERRHDGRIAVDRSCLRPGAPMASSSSAITGRRSRWRSRSTAAIGRLWALSPPPRALKARTFATSWSQRLSIALDQTTDSHRSSNGAPPTTALARPHMRPSDLPATLASNLGRRRSRARSRTEWPKPLSAPSNVIALASRRCPMHQER
jgi:hypothetical protein